MRIRNLFKVDPLKSFTELPAFKLTILLSGLLSTIFISLIILNSELVWRLDYVGFNSFVEIFRVPLSILAIAVTILAILATIHRSVQTKEQILIANKQNAFSNYYKHIEEFEKYMNSAIKSKILIFNNLRLAHKCLFPNAVVGNYNIDKGFLEVIENEFTRIKDLLNSFNRERVETVHNLLFEIHKGIDHCFSFLYIRIGRAGSQQMDGLKRIVVPSNNIKDIINEIKDTSLILIHILSFDREVVIPRSLQQVANLNMLEIPQWDFGSKKKFENFIVIKE